MDEKFTRKITQDDFITEKNDVIKNNLLGNYDENNEYHISQQIVEELISIDKLKKTTFGNSVFCVGNLLGYGEITFEVVYNNKTNDAQAQAFLFVLENVDKINGYLQNTIRTQIAHFTSDLDDFIEESYQKFNIVGTLDDEGKVKKNLDDMSLDDSYILAKKAYSLLLDKLEDEKVLDAYGKYFTARLALLTKFDNPFTNEILSHFNEEYTLIHGVFLQQKNYKTLNELLDKCIEEVSGTKEEFIKFEEDFNSAIREDLDKFITNMQTINDKSVDKAIDMLDKGDREKIKEILASNQVYEKDLSEEGVLSENSVAPKQTLETLAGELEELITPNDITENISLEKAYDLEDESSNDNDTHKALEENSSDSDGGDNVISITDEEKEIAEQIEENTPIDEINKLFEEEKEEASADEETLEESESSELDVEGDQLFDQLKNYVNDTPSVDRVDEIVEELEINASDEDVADIVSMFTENNNEEYVSEESVNTTEENEIVEDDVHEELNTLNNDFKESASSSIYDRLSRLKNNVQKGDREFKKPRPQSNNGKLDRLYDLLDRSMDR